MSGHVRTLPIKTPRQPLPVPRRPETPTRTSEEPDFHELATESLGTSHRVAPRDVRTDPGGDTRQEGRKKSDPCWGRTGREHRVVPVQLTSERFPGRSKTPVPFSSPVSRTDWNGPGQSRGTKRDKSHLDTHGTKGSSTLTLTRPHKLAHAHTQSHSYTYSKTLTHT